MEMPSISSAPRTVEDIFKGFSARRSAIVLALTSDVDEFYSLCDPEKENLCLYGNPNGSWEVTLPAEEVPPELPEPALGINFARDGMNRKDWLSLVAVHSDSWLLSVAFYLGARFNGNESIGQIQRSTNMIGEESALTKTTSQSLKNSALKQSMAKWKFVIGHHAIRSVSEHRGASSNTKDFQANGVDLYINGHDHCLEHISSLDRH